MPIVPSDIKFLFSGGAANSSPALSIGGAVSSVQVPDATLHALFPAFSGAQAEAGFRRYRCIYIKNSHATITLQNAVNWIASAIGSMNSTIQIGLGAAAISNTETAIADEQTEPDGVAFDFAPSYASGLSIGNLTAGQFKAVWISWEVGTGSQPFNGDECVISVQGDDGT